VGYKNVQPWCKTGRRANTLSGGSCPCKDVLPIAKNEESVRIQGRSLKGERTGGGGSVKFLFLFLRGMI